MGAALPPRHHWRAWAGDEFAVILPGVTLEHSQDSAEQLQRAVLGPFS